jgi:hypothetical protein
MKKSKSLLLLLVLSAIFYYGCNTGSTSADFYNAKSKPATEYANAYALRWLDLLCQQVRAQRIAPPAASRAFAYYGAALYQSVAPGIQGASSLSGQLAGFTAPLPDQNLEYNWEAVMNHTLYLVCDESLARSISPNDKSLMNLKNKIDSLVTAQGTSEEVMANSTGYGDALGNAIIEYMKTDNYDYTRENNIYESPSRAEHPEWWEPTDADKTALEPYWGMLRPMALDTTELCMMDPSIPFSNDQGSQFYQFTAKMYGIDTSFSEYERITSLYWADDPVETFTPPGHWMQIAKQQVKNNNYSLAQTAQVYCYLGASLYNAGISVWKTKYLVNLVRPVTYIQEVLNHPEYEPYIETPPFPEYPSGHSGFSGAASTILTHFFGDVPFTDSTNLMIGLMPREFKSFKDAANEAAYSRYYGGIHFEAGIIDGVKSGECLADKLLNKLQLVETAEAKH